MTDPLNTPVNVGPATETDLVAAVAEPVGEPVADPAPAEAPDALKAMIATLAGQLAASPQFAAAMRVAQRDAGTVPLREREIPAVNELVAYTHISNRSGLPLTQRGIVLKVDADTRTAHVIWLPDAEAMMPIDQLDDPLPA
ncbi:MAG TPA: hypothetical protein VKQ71_17630 [Acidimicrobiales bacterium]|nr:hypothetical protein [Acidimicrobiales bacterium]